MNFLSKFTWIFTVGIVISLFFHSQQTVAQSSQNELLKDFTATSLNIFKITETKYRKLKFDKVSKPWPISLEKNGDAISKVTINRAGIIEEDYEPDLAEYPAYFKDLKHRVLFVDGSFYYITWKSRKATIKYVLTEKDDLNGTPEEHTAKVEKYITKTVEAQSGDRAKIAEQKVEKETAEAKTNSLKGKNVKSIAVKWIGSPSELGHMSKIPYGIEATLSDGKKLKTKNLGGKTPWDDFKITVQGAEFGEEQLSVAKDASQISGDKVSITVQSKHQPSIKTSSTISLRYDAAIVLNYGGSAGGVVHLTVSPGYRGGNGTSLTVLVKGTTMADGKPINKVEVKDAQTGQVLHHLKLSLSTPFTINAMGGSGSFGRSSTRAGDGGNGGNITIIKDSSVSQFNYTVNNQGGNGGKHETSSLSNGSRGNKGSVSESTSSVNLAW